MSLLALFGNESLKKVIKNSISLLLLLRVLNSGIQFSIQLTLSNSWLLNFFFIRNIQFAFFLFLRFLAQTFGAERALGSHSWVGVNSLEVWSFDLLSRFLRKGHSFWRSRSLLSRWNALCHIEIWWAIWFSCSDISTLGTILMSEVAFGLKLIQLALVPDGVLLSLQPVDLFVFLGHFVPNLSD